MKRVARNKVIYSFSRLHKPVEYVDVDEPLILETEDALGGQVISEETPLDKIDWSRVNPATGPIYVKGVERGDTLVVQILDIKVSDRGVILVVPGYGVLGKKKFNPRVKIVEVRKGFVEFNGVKLRVDPVIGTIGVAPFGEEIPTGTPYMHGGNLDCTEVGRGVKLYLPVAAEGALFAAGDLHAVQADGELCVASVEVRGEILLKFSVIKGRMAKWPIIEADDHYSLLVSEDSIEKAVEIAASEVVKALMRAKGWTFEEAYMFSSLGINVLINQVVDPKKGVRAVIPKTLLHIDDLLLY